MIGSLGILLSGAVMKSYFIFLVKDLIPNEDYEKWLSDDGFKKNPEKDLSKTYLLNELKRLKERFRNDIMDSTALVHDDGTALSPIEIINLVQAHKNRIDKVRLMIEHDLSIVKIFHKPSEITYVYARAYWIDNNGKKFRKFVKNMGAEEKVYVNGKIPSFKLDEVEFTINQMMLEQYRLDYPN